MITTILDAYVLYSSELRVCAIVFSVVTRYPARLPALQVVMDGGTVLLACLLANVSVIIEAASAFNCGTCKVCTKSHENKQSLPSSRSKERFCKEPRENSGKWVCNEDRSLILQTIDGSLLFYMR